MSAPGQKDKFTPELRILVASLLSFGVIILWARFFGPKPPVQPTQANRPAQSAPATPGPATSPAAPSQATAAPSTMAPTKAASIAVKSDSQERTIVVENSLYRVEISNRGAVVKSWQLKNYKDDAKPQRVLDVVHPDASKQTGGWPFSVVLDIKSLPTAKRCRPRPMLNSSGAMATWKSANTSTLIIPTWSAWRLPLSSTATLLKRGLDGSAASAI